ncbi:MAG TPA: GNAT family N-acetyltransferase [Kofleriaceae bacterium]|jgi:GNAT superfamily N-acetyltransferase
MIIRGVTEADLPSIAAMVDDFVSDHKAASHPRPLSSLRAAYLGPSPIAHLLVASLSDRVVGMVEWSLFYDQFWALIGVRGEWLYVTPSARGLGVPAALVAELCSRGRASGAAFLRAGAYTPAAERLYERVALGSPSYECFVSAEAFQHLADLAGQPARSIVRNLPSPALSRTPARPR